MSSASRYEDHRFPLMITGNLRTLLSHVVASTTPPRARASSPRASSGKSPMGGCTGSSAHSSPRAGIPATWPTRSTTTPAGGNGVSATASGTPPHGPAGASRTGSKPTQSSRPAPSASPPTPHATARPSPAPESSEPPSLPQRRQTRRAGRPASGPASACRGHGALQLSDPLAKALILSDQHLILGIADLWPDLPSILRTNERASGSGRGCSPPRC